MPDKTIEQRVKEIISSQLEVDIEKINLKSSFRDDLNADSLDAVELIMAFEEEFKNEMGKDEIPEEDAEALTTVEAVVNYITNKGKPSKKAPAVKEPAIASPSSGFSPGKKAPAVKEPAIASPSSGSSSGKKAPVVKEPAIASPSSVASRSRSDKFDAKPQPTTPKAPTSSSTTKPPSPSSP